MCNPGVPEPSILAGATSGETQDHLRWFHNWDWRPCSVKLRECRTYRSMRYREREQCRAERTRCTVERNRFQRERQVFEHKLANCDRYVGTFGSMDPIVLSTLCTRRQESGIKVVSYQTTWRESGCSIEGPSPLDGALVIIVKKPLVFHGNVQLSGSIAFRGLGISLPGPCLTVHGNLTVASGIINFDRCASKQGPGGVSATRMVQKDGQVVFKRCIGKAGGGLFLKKGLEQLGGNLTFQECQATVGGGLFLLSDSPGRIGARVKSNGTIAFQACKATRAGGGLYAGGEETQPLCSSGMLQWTGGAASFVQCQAPSGGCLGGGGFLLTKTRLEFRKCRAEHSGKVKLNESIGGAIAFCDMLELDHTIMNIRGCLSDAFGGAIGSLTCANRTSSLTVQGGSLNIQNCYAETGSGGGLLIKDLIFARRTNISVDGCVAQGSGGGAAAGGVDFVEVDARFENCDAREGAGGGLHLRDTWKAREATAVFTSCTSSTDGGCAVFGTMDSRGTRTKFQRCTAGRNGGGISIAGKVTSHESQMEFQDCNARGQGGCASVHQVDMHYSHLDVRNCYAETGSGGGLLIQDLIFARRSDISIDGCVAQGSGGGAAAGGVDFVEVDARFENCDAREGAGGGLHLRDTWKAREATAVFTSCTSSTDGGCAVFGTMDSRAARTKFQKCTAGRNGGGIFIASKLTSHASQMEFQDCNAREQGGCASLHGVDTASQIMRFERCRAESGDGGGLHVHGNWTGEDANVSRLLSFLFLHVLVAHLLLPAFLRYCQEGGRVNTEVVCRTDGKKRVLETTRIPETGRDLEVFCGICCGKYTDSTSPRNPSLWEKHFYHELDLHSKG